jgi:hypothetical protein
MCLTELLAGTAMPITDRGSVKSDNPVAHPSQRGTGSYCDFNSEQLFTQNSLSKVA